MRKWLGSISIVLGALCLLSAIGFMLYNRWEASNAAQTSQALLEEVQQVVQKDKIPTQENHDQESTVPTEAPTVPTEMPTEMATVKVDGYDCIGILSIPVLELELPVLADWSYEKLTKAPCHYYGAYYETDFVIAAHNYAAHFGRLSELKPGDLVVFTDVAANAYHYEVVLLETLSKEATQEMIASGFDLSLYTCTPGGGSRVTVRCSKVTSP